MDRELQSELSESLLQRFAWGDDAAFGRIVEIESPRILKRIRERLPSSLKPRIGPSDVLQLSCVDMLRQRHRFRDRGLASFRKWVEKIVEGNLSDSIKYELARKRNADREVVDIESPTHPHRAVAPGPSPSSIVTRSEAIDRLAESVHQLSVEDRRIIRLVDEQDLSFTDVATRLGISHVAAKKRHSRAIRRLRDILMRVD
ncbi:MAG: sigma-70 family RNA polymerase sigma factor [Planctomycetes bacterium]|nr:sigma-70 family RNA polymerase sigma factor [Planctomycetota bacterium]